MDIYLEVRGASLLFLALVALSAACGGGGGSTPHDAGTTAPPADSGEARDVVQPDVGQPEPDVSEDVAARPRTVQPRIVLAAPGTGMWAPTVEQVTVRGRVEEGSAPLTSLVIADREVPVAADGTFSVEVPAQPGVNVVGVRAEAEDGGRAVEGRGFFAGDSHAPGAVISGAAWAELTEAFLDDDDDEPDDLARLVELLLENPEFLALLDMPIETESMTVTPSGAALGSAHVEVFPRDGVLSLVVRLVDTELSMSIEGLGDEPSPGRLWAEEVVLQLDLAITLVDGQIEVEAVWVDASLEGFGMTSELIEDFLGEEPAVYELVRGFIEDGIEQQVAESVVEMLGGLLSALAFDFSYGEEPELGFRLVVEDVAVDGGGLYLTLGAAVSAPMGDGHPNLALAGSFRTTSAPPPRGFSRAPVGFAVDDDVLNQLFFAYWYGGGLSRWVAYGDELEALGVTDLPEVFEPIHRIEMDAPLPPVLTARALDDEFGYDMAVGDFSVRVATEDDRKFALRLSLRAGVTAFVDEQDHLRFQADRRPRWVEVHVGVDEAPPGVDPGSVAALVRLMVAPILGRTNEGLPTFPLPGLPLSAFLDIPSLEDKEIALPVHGVRRLAPEGHFVVLEGAPVMRDVAPE